MQYRALTDVPSSSTRPVRTWEKQPAPLLPPHISVTNGIGYIYEVDDIGEYKRATCLMEELEDADIVAI